MTNTHTQRLSLYSSSRDLRQLSGSSSGGKNLMQFAVSREVLDILQFPLLSIPTAKVKLYFAFRQEGTRQWWAEILKGFLFLIIWEESQEGFLFPTTHPFFPKRQLVEKSTSKLETGFACWVANVIITQIRDYQPEQGFLSSASGFSLIEIDFSSCFMQFLYSSKLHFMDKKERSWNLFDLLLLLGPAVESTIDSASLQCWASPGSPFGFILVWLLPTDRVLISSSKNLGTHSWMGRLSTYLVNS